MRRVAIALGLAFCCVLDADTASSAGVLPMVVNPQPLVLHLGGSLTADPSPSSDSTGCGVTFTITYPPGINPGHYLALTYTEWYGVPGSASGSWSRGTTTGRTFVSGTNVVSKTVASPGNCSSTQDLERLDACVANAQDNPSGAASAPGVCDAGQSDSVYWVRQSVYTAPASCHLPVVAASYISGQLAVLVTPSGGTYPAGGWRADNPALVPDGSGHIIFPDTPKMTITSADQVPGTSKYFKQAAATMSGTTFTLSQLDGAGAPSCAVTVTMSLTNAVTSGGGTDQAGDGSTDCGLSLNIAHDIKCALQWAFAPSNSISAQWSNLKTSFTNTGPGGLIVSGISTISSLVSALTGIGYDGCGQGIDCYGQGPDDGYGNHLDLFAAMATLPGLSYIRAVMISGIWMMAAFVIWRIVRRHLGAQV